MLGSGVEPLFWMCDSCSIILTKDKEETEILLEMCSQYWTNPSDCTQRMGARLRNIVTPDKHFL